jgi:hypothetical protein
LPPTDHHDWELSRRGVVGGLAALATGAAVRAAGPAGSSLTPERFGAKGDGVTDDTDAFLRLSAALNDSAAGEVDLRPNATYLAGRQLHGEGQFLIGQPAISAKGLKRLVVRMNGATLKFRPGLRFGSFDRAGGIRPTTLPFFDRTARADIGHMIDAQGVAYLSVSGGRIDCNSAGAIVGGRWGDAGWQCAHAGIVAYGCDMVDLSDLEIVDSCLDGIVLGYGGLRAPAPPKPITLRRVSVRRVARNCLSLVGTNSTLIEDCTFEKAGGARIGRAAALRSAPASCLDIEAEESECRNIVIRRTKLLSGPGTSTAIVADSGPSRDIRVQDSLLVGAVWAGKPGMRFERCRIYGYFARLTGGQANPVDNTVVTDCTLVDQSAEHGYATDYPLAIDLEGGGPGVRISGTRISLSRTRLNLRNGVLQNVEIAFATGADRAKNREFAILLDGAKLTDVIIEERIPVAKRPVDAFYVTAPGSAVRSSIVSSDGKLLWNSWSRAAGGHAGKP